MQAVNYLKDPECAFFVTNEDLSFPGQDDMLIPGEGNRALLDRSLTL